MAKPLVERKSTVKSLKSKRRKVKKGPSDDFQVVSEGGNIRRITFEGEFIEPEPAPEPEPQPEPEPERPAQRPSFVDFQRVGSRSTEMRSLHEEIDHLMRVDEPTRVREPQEETVTRYVSPRPESLRYDERAIDALLERVHFTDKDEVVEEPAPEPEPKKAPAKKPVKKAAKKPAAKAPAKKPAAKPKAKPAPKKPARKALPYDYKGDVHFVVDLEGIGPVLEKKLHGAKIYNTQELLFTTDAKLQKITGSPPKSIQNWKHMSQLVKVKGIGPQFAELMVRAGIEGIEDLRKLHADRAVAQIKEYTKGLKSNITGSGIGMKRMTAWQDEAKAMRKVPIDLKKIEPISLESRQAISHVKVGEKKKPSASKKAVKPTSSFPKDLAKKPAAKPATKKAPAKKPAAKKPATKAAAKPKAASAKKAPAKKAPAKKPVAKAAAKPKAAPAKAPAKKAASKPAAKPAAKKVAAASKCAAKTAAGKACQNAPRGRSKYCASHKGYRA